MTAFGAPRSHFRVTDSTNDRARELAVAGAPSGAVVTADEQSAGRGRLGRTWSAPPGRALLCSAILRPLGPEHALLPLAVPLAVCETAEALAPVDCAVKWPNDVLVEGRKLAGVLIEARPPDWAVIGVGLNVAIEPHEFPPDLRTPATSLGADVTVAAALDGLCESLASWVDAPAERVLAEYRRRDALRGREVRWDEGSGVADGIADDGNLLVRTGAGEVLSLGSGEVSLAPGA